MLKLFRVLDLPKSGIVVLQLLCVWLCILFLICDVMSCYAFQDGNSATGC
jgi:hypothetical protein